MGNCKKTVGAGGLILLQKPIHPKEKRASPGEMRSAGGILTHKLHRCRLSSASRETDPKEGEAGIIGNLRQMPVLYYHTGNEPLRWCRTRRLLPRAFLRCRGPGSSSCCSHLSGVQTSPAHFGLPSDVRVMVVVGAVHGGDAACSGHSLAEPFPNLLSTYRPT